MASKSSRVSRRRILKTAGAAAVGGGAAFLGGGAVAQGQAPAILTNTQAGRRFKAFVKYNTSELPNLVDVTARALSGNQVLLRVEAAQTCYTSIDQVLIAGTPTNQATIVGHGGVGIVEAIGPQVISTASAIASFSISTLPADAATTVCGCVRTSVARAPPATRQSPI